MIYPPALHLTYCTSSTRESSRIILLVGHPNVLQVGKQRSTAALGPSLKAPISRISRRGSMIFQWTRTEYNNMEKVFLGVLAGQAEPGLICVAWWWACLLSAAIYPLVFAFYYFPSVVDTPAMQHATATSHVTPMSLHNHSLALSCPHWPHYQLHHQTSFMYWMYMWSMDSAVTFPFLDGSPHCFLMIFSLFDFTDLPLWYLTALLSYLTHPDVGWPVLSYCTMWSVSQWTAAVLLWMILVLISLIVIFCI